MADDSEFYSIVVTGAMNPSIHHPSWYRLVELIDEDEADEAYQNKNTFAMPPLSQLETGGFKIVCQEGRWEVQTQRAEKIERLWNLAATVFDDLLKHTPVSAYGFNFNYRRSTKCNEVARILADELANTALGLMADNAIGGELIFRRKCDDGHTTMTVIRPAKHASSVSVNNNYHYPLEGVGEGFFNLREKFAERVPLDQEDAVRQTENVVQALNQRCEQ